MSMELITDIIQLTINFVYYALSVAFPIAIVFTISGVLVRTMLDFISGRNVRFK